MSTLSNNNDLVALLENTCKKYPDKIAFTYLHNGEIEGKQSHITYQQLSTKAKAIAQTIQKVAKAGDRVLIILDSDLDFIAAFFGCLYAQVIAVPAYPPVTPEFAIKLQNIIDDSAPVLAISNNNFMTKIKLLHVIKWVKKLKLDVFLNKNYQTKFIKLLKLSTWDFDRLRWINLDKITTQDISNWQKPIIDPNSIAFLQYTSGSTGTPKGVMVTHKNLLHNVKVITRQVNTKNTTNIKCAFWLPLYHDMGLINGIIVPIYLSSPCILMSPFAFLQKPLRWLRVISHYQITHSGAPNFAYDLCIARTTLKERETLDLSSWQLAFTGAEPIRINTLKEFCTIFKISKFNPSSFYPCYGLAEATLMVSGSNSYYGPVYLSIKKDSYQENNIIICSDIDNNNQISLISCGKKGRSIDLKIVNPETQQLLPELTIGEIWLRSHSIAKGYWNKPQESHAIFNAYITDQSGPYLRTGDLGFLHQGELYVTGRSKDVIIINGRNYYPQDIEMTVEHSHEQIRSGCTIAFSSCIDNKERLIILVEIKKDYSQHQIDTIIDKIKISVLQNNGLCTHAIGLLEPHTLIKTTSGKLRRSAMHELYEKNQLTIIKHWQA